MLCCNAGWCCHLPCSQALLSSQSDTPLLFNKPPNAKRRRGTDQTLLHQLLQGLAFYSFVEEQQSSSLSASDDGEECEPNGSFVSKAEERLAQWLHAEQQLEQQQQQSTMGSPMLIDAPHPGLLSAPPGAVHRSLPPLLIAEAAADGSGAYRLRRRTSGSGRRDRRPSVGRRRAISEFAVSLCLNQIRLQPNLRTQDAGRVLSATTSHLRSPVPAPVSPPVPAPR